MKSLLFAAAVLCAAPAFAYESVEVKDGGSIAGTVTLKGKPKAPPEAVFPKDLAAADKKFCSGRQPLAPPFYVVDSSARLKDVVVWLEGVKKGKAAEKETKLLLNEDCRFGPHVQSVTTGSELQVENRDPILHNTHPIYIGDQSTLFNLALPEQGQKVKKKVRRAGVLKVQCDAGHVWMRAFVHAFEHPYHAVTGADGSFRLADVPPGRYTLKLWHEAAGTQEAQVEVAAGGAVKQDFSFEVK